MKKRTKITLRTKIYLTIVGLLALTGIIYAANPFVFSTFPGLTGVAATTDELFATGFVDPNSAVYTLDCMGIPTVYEASANAEKYLAIAPVQSAAAGFTPRDVFLTYGQLIYRATPPGFFTFFAQVTCSENEFDHTGITFDKVGHFGNDMIVSCQGGNVFQVDAAGNSTFLASTTDAQHDTKIQGPAIAPDGFGPFGGQILVADELSGQVHAIDYHAGHTVTHNVFNWPGGFAPSPEALAFIPDPLCTYCGYAFFQASQQSPAGLPSMFAYAPMDFQGLGGSLLVTLEQDQRIDLVQFIAGNYVTSVFDTPPGYNILEGSSIVDCDVPTPTPTPTPLTPTPTPSPSPTATFTPIPTATATATATATFTPVPTPTATSTATSTPTTTATATATATATFTPTPTVTATPTPTPEEPLIPACEFPTEISSNFNGTPINAGNYIWFTSVLKPSGLGLAPVTIHFTGQTIRSANFLLSVPDADVTFDPTVFFATTTFSGGMWVTTVPASGLPGNTFFSGFGYLVPANLPGGINPVTWNGTISSTSLSVSVSWKWTAAVYTNFAGDPNNLGVKPVDANTQNPYPNSDHAGTPENFKSFVTGGARGGGGSNYTGSYSGTDAVGPCTRRRGPR